MDSSYGKALPILLICLLMNTVCWSYDLGTAICPKPPASLFENRRHSHQLAQRFICHLEGNTTAQENSRTTRQEPNVTYFAAAKISYHHQRSILQRAQEREKEGDFLRSRKFPSYSLSPGPYGPCMRQNPESRFKQGRKFHRKTENPRIPGLSF
jgi:hypothetical protein